MFAQRLWFVQVFCKSSKIVFFFCYSEKIQLFIYIKACRQPLNDAFMYYLLFFIWKYNINQKFHCIFFGKLKKSTILGVFHGSLRPYIGVNIVEFRYFFLFLHVLPFYSSCDAHTARTQHSHGCALPGSPPGAQKTEKRHPKMSFSLWYTAGSAFRTWCRKILFYSFYFIFAHIWTFFWIV